MAFFCWIDWIEGLHLSEARVKKANVRKNVFHLNNFIILLVESKKGGIGVVEVECADKERGKHDY
jgi:hypothetical protein